MNLKQEKENRIRAGLATVAVSCLVFLIMLLTAAWRTAGEGQGEYPGIEVNLGYDDQGSGDIQPDAEVGDEQAKDTDNPAVDPLEGQPKQETPAPTSEQEQPSTTTAQSNTLTDANSDVEIKEETKDKPIEKPVDKKVTDTKEKPVETKVTEQPKVDQTAVYQGKSKANPTTKGDGEGKQGVTGSEGDDIGKTGDKGVEGGVEGAAIYKGTPGGGDGGDIVLNGWSWDNVEKPKVPQNETGRVVFEIAVDENGELISRRKISGTVSPAAEQACISAIERITFTRKPGANVPAVTKGTITYVIRAQ
ncbi:MAG TPA: hypothetical protein VEB86_16940 [Chryseosolibacter sp.]|nr:hypothetical protein [Chryseosolibacter sp.]